MIKQSIVSLLAATFLLAMPLAANAQMLERELYVLVEFDAEQDWLSETEEFGRQHWHAETTQRYELRTRLQAKNALYGLNLLDPDLETRLKAKTIHLARKAIERMEDQGQTVKLPETPEERAALARQMQEAQYACGGDPVCRRQTAEHYAAIFAALEYPEATQRNVGLERYRYYEPAADCSSYSRVSMQMTITGEHWNKSEKEVVPFTEKRSADVENPSDDVPVCQRYLAVIDKQDAARPMYVENFYLPSAPGETVVTELEQTRREQARQPMVTDVLTWVTKQLKHAKTAGSKTEVISLTHPVNGVSETSGAWQGEADVNLTWRFSEPGESVPESVE